MAVAYPPVGFHFLVTFALPGVGDVDTRFQDVSGLSSEVTTEEYVEGGENRFAYKLPTGARHGNLTLRRGLAHGSALGLWVRAAVEEFFFLPSAVTVALLNEQHLPVATWFFSGVYPVRWMASDLSAKTSDVVIESIELAFQSQRSVYL